MKIFYNLVHIWILLVPAYGITGFRAENPTDLRRQIPYTQGQVLPDETPRFAPIPSVGFSQQQNNFLQQPSLELSPNQFAPNPQQFGHHQPQQYRQLLQQNIRTPPESPVFETINQQQFIDNRNTQFASQVMSQANNNFQDNYFSRGQLSQQSPPHPLNHQLPAQSPTLHSFLPTIPTETKSFSQNIPVSTNSPVPAFPNVLAPNPSFSSEQTSHLQTLLEEQRKQDLERLKELQERQKIIQKHQQFLERQQQKQQQKVKKLHEEFVAKQKKKEEEIYATVRTIQDVTPSQNPIPSREIYPHELSLFEKAIKQQEIVQPTTIVPDTPATKKNLNRSRSRQRSNKNKAESDSAEFIIQSNKQKNYKQSKSSAEENDKNEKLQYIGKQDLLKQLKLALAENSNDVDKKNFSSREISLPNGEKFEIIKTSDPKLIAGATPLTSESQALAQLIPQNQFLRKSIKTPKFSFEDLSKDVLPPGADFEVIKQSGNGNLEEIGKIPSHLSDEKKVTFVFIEEQNDGSYKVKGVKGNEESDTKNPEVENVIKKIQEGQIKFPTITKQPEPVSSTKTPYPLRENSYTTRSGATYSKITSKKPTSYQNFEATKIASTTPKYYNSASPSSLSINHNGSPSPSSLDYENSSKYGLTTPLSTDYYKSSTVNEKYSEGTANYNTYSTMVNGHQMHPADSVKFSQVPDLAAATTSNFAKDDLSIISNSNTYFPSTNIVSRSTTPKSSFVETSSPSVYTSNPRSDLIDILKESGLFAAAKYIKQSGLDTILNETGPYTVFAPTDKAFRTLLIQLGGPDRAEEKFKENPRLLSGLLLHHIIPGAFEISTLQDEMTGVSLAGTQLRVNQYDMHDVEWNEIKVTTINGARVLNEKQDIRIPQGIAHAVDRVMFPLPVGDIVQTLQADRERRFTNFLKALFNSGMVEALSDSRTYTVFAPTDKAFSSLSSEELQQLVSDKERSKELVTKHIAPGTLFSAGMRYYQIRDTMAQEKPITLQKNAGRIKVNSGHVITHNIPATNGVIHAVDTLL